MVHLWFCMSVLEYVLACVLGAFCGVFGGMGMGGGTLLIPLLTIFYSTKQHTAQAINLIGFIPMAVVALIIHIKHKLIRFDNVVVIIISGAITCVAGCFLAKIMSGNLLKRCFGGFLVGLSIFQFVDALNYEKNK